MLLLPSGVPVACKQSDVEHGLRPESVLYLKPICNLAIDLSNSLNSFIELRNSS